MATSNVLFEGQVDSILVPASTGICQILPQHAPYFFNLNNGDVSVTQRKSTTFVVTIQKGIVDMTENSCTIFVTI